MGEEGSGCGWVDVVTTPFKMLWKFLKWWWSLNWKLRVGLLVALIAGIGGAYAYFSGMLSWKYWSGSSSFGDYTTKTDKTKKGTVKSLSDYKDDKGKFMLKMKDIEEAANKMDPDESGSDEDEPSSNLEESGSDQEDSGSDQEDSDSEVEE
jgi:hypothetical protein